jgi:uncharacterized protein
MKTAIILHGKPPKEEYFDEATPSPSNLHWLPWLQKQLLQKKVLAQTPELPEPYAPAYAKWRAVFEQFRIDKDATLVGHSCGAGFLLRWLSENKVETGKVALVAPFLDPNRNKVEKDFFLFEMDENLAARTGGVNVFYSTDDGPDILTSVGLIKNRLKDLKFTEFSNRGHFTFTEKFPELLQWLS